jgi:GDPmannose 4,6-dehydratase
VTRKIAEWVKGYVKNPFIPTLELGNLDAKRDWSYVLDTVDAIYRVCNQDEFNKNFTTWTDYCFGSGISHSVREFLSLALCMKLGLKELGERFEFRGSGLQEVLYDKKEKLACVGINPEYFRPSEVDHLQCDATLIRKNLGWEPKYTLLDIVNSMVL